MCAIIGYKGTFEPELVEKLLDNSRLRGVHSFGFSYYQQGQLVTTKFEDYQSFKEWLLDIKPELFIAHFRYSTSGDFRDLDNAQPLQDGSTAIAFNGVISQATKEEMEQQFDCEFKSDNDGWILLRHYLSFEEVLTPGASVATVGLNGGKLSAYRNNKRPLWVSQADQVIVASTKDILKRSGIDTGFPISPEKKLVW